VYFDYKALMSPVKQLRGVGKYILTAAAKKERIHKPHSISNAGRIMRPALRDELR
jgi:hypothetical protein